MKLKPIVLVLLVLALCGCKTPKTKVTVCATIHRAHEMNPNYTYEDLYSFIDSLNPDIIGVEIRKEDIDSSISYLEKNYPFEMYEIINKYGNKKTVYGFDWLGKDIEGKEIPNNYWNEINEIKKVDRKLYNDSIAVKSLTALEDFKNQKMEIALKATIFELNDGRYDSINKIYYNQYEEILKETEYKQLPQFFKDRDEMIAKNIMQIIHDNSDKKILFLTGADHRSYVIEKLNKELGDDILLNDAFDKN